MTKAQTENLIITVTKLVLIKPTAFRRVRQPRWPLTHSVYVAAQKREYSIPRSEQQPRGGKTNPPVIFIFQTLTFSLYLEQNVTKNTDGLQANTPTIWVHGSLTECTRSEKKSHPLSSSTSLSSPKILLSDRTDVTGKREREGESVGERISFFFRRLMEYILIGRPNRLRKNSTLAYFIVFAGVKTKSRAIFYTRKNRWSSEI